MRYAIYYRTEISSAHKLDLPYKSKCKRWHGHNYLIEVFINTNELNESGMIIDFTILKKILHRLDHRMLNRFLKQPTAERIAGHFCKLIKAECDPEAEVKVRVWEDKDSYAEASL